jgi:hypothetical protein
MTKISGKPHRYTPFLDLIDRNPGAERCEHGTLKQGPCELCERDWCEVKG